MKDYTNLVKGFAVAAHISGYIIGPLILFGGLGLLLDRTFGTYPFVSIGALFLAFIISNVLIYKRALSILDTHNNKK